MTKKNTTKTIWRLCLAALLSISILSGLAACSSSPENSGSSSTATNALTTENPYGKPWASSIFSDNLPQDFIIAKDDLFTYAAQSFLETHQADAPVTGASLTKGELRTSVEEAIKDESYQSAEMDQLRILYNQATDTAKLEEIGTSELKPYLEAIADTTSLEELEALLLSEDFPFTPWINLSPAAADMMSDMGIGISPHMLFADATTGTDMYIDSDDPEIQAAHDQTRHVKTIEVNGYVSMLSIGNEDETEKTTEALFALEKKYGKDNNQDKYLGAEYGLEENMIKAYTIEEIEQICPNFPIRKTLDKFSPGYDGKVVVLYPDWVASFNEIWTEENFPRIKELTELKVLAECADLLPQSYFSGTLERLNQTSITSEDMAWKVCDRTNTFSQLLAKTYVNKTLGESAANTLEKLANELIDAYIELVETTPWLSAASREKIADKLDNMALNILVPDGGYFDYSDLDLVPTEKGGTLFSNYLRLKAYNDEQKTALLGKPARASAVWIDTSPTTANCFYDPTSNSINIFPGYVTSNVYYKGISEEELLGGIGFVTAHEMSHAFDHLWSRFDAYGRPDPVFTQEDAAKFAETSKRLADYYSKIELVPGKNINGTSVMAEATADLSGMQVICACGQKDEKFNYSRMFTTFARTFEAVYPPAYADMLLESDHAPNNARVNVSAQMMEKFAETYRVEESSGMYVAPEERILIWGEKSGQATP